MDYIRIKFFRGYWRTRLYKKHPAKTINDSYTPQSLKFQVLSVPIFCFFIALSFFQIKFLFFPLCILFIFVFHSIPFIKLFYKSKYKKSYFIPAVLFVRAASIFTGLLLGIINEFINSIRTLFT